MHSGARKGSKFGAAVMGGVSVVAVTAATLVGHTR